MERYFRELLEGRRQALGDRLLLALLRLPALVYALVMVLRAGCYRTGLFRSNRLPRPTVAVGNLTVGGTGKTPTVALLVRLLHERGKRVAVLSRGYGGSREHEGGLVSDGTSVILSPVEAGDEPYLLACSLPGLVVAVGADRYRSGLLAIERCNPDIFILDDGFQHLRLERDLNILLLDGGRPFANGATLPAGLLREPVAAARRADLVLFTRCGDGEPPAVLPGIPFCRSRHRLAGVRRPDAAPLEPVASLASQRVLAFAGIADPAAFFAALAAEGVDPVETLALPDHVAYGEPEIATLCRLRDASGATCLVTTEKDGVKLGPWLHRLGMLYVTVLQLEIDDDGPLRAALEKLL